MHNPNALTAPPFGTLVGDHPVAEMTWTTLDPGEILRQGDEYWDVWKWRPVMVSVGMRVGKDERVRRPYRG